MAVVIHEGALKDHDAAPAAPADFAILALCKEAPQ
jgi:hypothetical protein